MKYKCFPLGALWTNGYLFWDEGGRAFFVDPGGEAGDVFAFMKERKLQLKAVFLTHGHLDHLSGIESFVPLVGDFIYISDEDAPLLRRPSAEMQAALRMRCGGVERFRSVKDGDVLEIGDLRVEVLATPGHTPGGVCYRISQEKQSVLVSGDTLFAQSVGRTDLPGGDQFTLDESLRKLATLPDDLIVLPGHGPETSIGQERQNNPFWPL